MCAGKSNPLLPAFFCAGKIIRIPALLTFPRLSQGERRNKEDFCAEYRQKGPSSRSPRTRPFRSFFFRERIRRRLVRGGSPPSRLPVFFYPRKIPSRAARSSERPLPPPSCVRRDFEGNKHPENPVGKIPRKIVVKGIFPGPGFLVTGLVIGQRTKSHPTASAVPVPGISPHTARDLLLYPHPASLGRGANLRLLRRRAGQRRIFIPPYFPGTSRPDTFCGVFLRVPGFSLPGTILFRRSKKPPH